MANWCKVYFYLHKDQNAYCLLLTLSHLSSSFSQTIQNIQNIQNIHFAPVLSSMALPPPSVQSTADKMFKQPWLAPLTEKEQVVVFLTELRLFVFTRWSLWSQVSAGMWINLKTENSTHSSPSPSWGTERHGCGRGWVVLVCITSLVWPSQLTCSVLCDLPGVS